MLRILTAYGLGRCRCHGCGGSNATPGWRAWACLVVARTMLSVLERMVLAEEDDDRPRVACSIGLDDGGDDARSGDGNHGASTRWPRSWVQWAYKFRWGPYELWWASPMLPMAGCWCCVSSQPGELQGIGGLGIRQTQLQSGEWVEDGAIAVWEMSLGLKKLHPRRLLWGRARCCARLSPVRRNAQSTAGEGKLTFVKIRWVYPNNSCKNTL